MERTFIPSGAGLQPIRLALNNNSITGHSNLYALTGNYRHQLQAQAIRDLFHRFHGMRYYRTSGFTGTVTSGTGVTCAPAWLWWGFSCVSGTVTANQTLGGRHTSSVFGGNVGGGFTIKVGDLSYRIYIEPRYHYAPTKNIATQLMELTVGIRYRPTSVNFSIFSKSGLCGFSIATAMIGLLELVGASDPGVPCIRSRSGERRRGCVGPCLAHDFLGYILSSWS